MKTKREVLERFAEEGYCSSIDCRECSYLELCSSDENLTIKGRLQKIGAMAILRMFPKKKKPMLEVGTKIKFKNGKYAIIKANEQHYFLTFENYEDEEYTLEYLIGKTWEIVE